MQPHATDLFGEPTRDPEQSQLFTPMWLARRMVTWIRRDARVLEPACGTGNLLAALVEAGHRPELLAGIERDARMVDFARERLPGVDVRCSDFFDLGLADAPADVVLMNPPYEENAHLRFVLRALRIAPVVIALVPADFEFTQARDAELWAARGVVRRRAILPERVRFAGEGGQNEHVALLIARRMQARRYGEERLVCEETWRPGDVGPLEHLASVP